MKTELKLKCLELAAKAACNGEDMLATAASYFGFVSDSREQPKDTRHRCPEDTSVPR